MSTYSPNFTGSHNRYSDQGHIQGDMSGIDTTAASTGSSGIGYAPSAAGISTLSGVLSNYHATKAFEAQLDAKTNAAIQNVGNAVTSFELQQVKNQENIRNLNHVLGDKLSERGLNAMKEASLLKAAAAETGTTGGTTDMAVKEAFINENMDKANIISTARQQRRQILSSMDIQSQQIKSTIDSKLLGGGIEINTNPLLTGLQGGLNVGMQTLQMLPMSERVEAFGIKPQGSY